MPAKQWKTPPAMGIDVKKKYFATIETDKGEIELQFFPEHAPKTVNNFVFLAREGFYDGVKFHRVISNFVVQGGDPTGTGMGGPGYKFEDETRGNPLIHEAGVMSMANAGPNTNGSQFFLVYGDSTGLPASYTILGTMDAAGLSVVKTIAAAGVTGGGTDGAPALATTIETVTVGSSGTSTPTTASTNAETVTSPAAT